MASSPLKISRLTQTPRLVVSDLESLDTITVHLSSSWFDLDVSSSHRIFFQRCHYQRVRAVSGANTYADFLYIVASLKELGNREFRRQNYRQAIEVSLIVLAQDSFLCLTTGH